MINKLRNLRTLARYIRQRAADYSRLLIIDLEIQKQLFMNRMVSLAIFSVFLFLSLVFLGIAIIFSFVNTPYLVMAAWGVFSAYTLILVISAVAYLKNRSSGPVFSDIRRELKQDIDMMKDLL